MAKKVKAPAKKVAEKKAAAKAVEAKLPFGVAEAAKHLDTNPTYLRAKLRNANVKKAGKSYGWKSKTEMVAALKKVEGVSAVAS